MDAAVTVRQLADYIQYLVPPDNVRMAYLGKKVTDIETAFQNFKKFAFLDAHTIGDSENEYIEGIIGDWKELSYAEISKGLPYGLETLIQDRLNTAISSANTQHKSSVLSHVKNHLKATLASWRLAKEKMPLFLTYMKEDKKKLYELIDKIAEKSDKRPDSIPGYGYIKSTLWIHECGYGFDISPASHQLKLFLSENDEEFKSLAKYERKDDSTGSSFYVINGRLTAWTDEVNKITSNKYSVSDVDGCICIYEKMRSLAKNKKLGNEATISAIQKYMGKNRMRIKEFYEKYADIDKVDEMGTDFAKYLKSSP